MHSLSPYKVITLTHKNAQLKNLGKFVLTDVSTDEALADRLSMIKQGLGIEEILYLATCNRILFFVVQEQALDKAGLERFVKYVYAGLETEDQAIFVDNASAYEGEEAIRHLFEVASSIDSLVVGEREILRQLRTAYAQCSGIKSTGDSIRLAMRFTVETAKKIYSQTRIGEKPISVVSLAMRQLFKQNLTKQSRFLIVGAGQTNSLVAKFLKKQGFEHYAVFNRTLQNAERLAAFLGGTAHTLEDLSTYDKGFDVLIACTGAAEAIIKTDLYEQLLRGEKNQKVLVDLAVPYNIDARIPAEQACHYIEIEAIKELAKENLAFREEEVSRAKMLLNEDVEEFKAIYKARQIELAMREVPKQIKAIKQHAVSSVFKNEFDALDSNSKEVVEKILAYMEKRCIAIPLQVAKENLAGISNKK